MFYQIFLSPQVKRRTIITYKHGIYELPGELLNDLRNCLNLSGNCLTRIALQPSAQYPRQNESSANTRTNLKNRN